MAARKGDKHRGIGTDIYRASQWNILGEYKVLLEIPDNADKNILSSSAELIGEGKAVACILKGGNVIAVVGYRE